MISRWPLPTVAALLLLGSWCLGQQVVQQTPKSANLRTFQAAKDVSDAPAWPTGEVWAYAFELGGYKYWIRADGRGKRTKTGTAPRDFELSLESGDSLEHHLFYAPHRDGIVLLYEINLGDGGAASIVKLNRQTLRTRWRQRIPAFNVGRALAEGDYAYVTGIGFIGKVNLILGTYVWQHDDLYRGEDKAPQTRCCHFNSFETPRIEGNAVLFEETPEYYLNNLQSIRVDKESGRILRKGEIPPPEGTPPLLPHPQN